MVHTTVAATVAHTTAAATTVAAVPATAAATTTSAIAVKSPILISPPSFSWAEVVSVKISGQVSRAPVSPRAQAKSFQDVLENNGTIKQKIPSTFRGEPAVFFSKEEIAKLASPFRYTLIGKFSYQRPPMEIIRNFFIALGLKSLQSVGLLQENHIVIFITKEEDYTRLLLRSTWYIFGAPMKVLKWSPEFYPSVESPVVPVWVGLPGLPLHFFEKSALFCITSVLGTPLKVDEPTAKLSRPTVLRICVEVDVSKARPHRIWLDDEKDGYWQEVIFENPPQYCDFCKVLGHDSISSFEIPAKIPEEFVEPPPEKLGHFQLVADSAGKMQSAISLTPLNPNRQVRTANTMVKIGGECNSKPLDLKYQHLEPLDQNISLDEERNAASQPSIAEGKVKKAAVSSPALHASSVATFSATDEMADKWQKGGGGKPWSPSDQANLEPWDSLSSSPSSHPFLQNQIKIQPLDGKQFKGDNFLSLLSNEQEKGRSGEPLVVVSASAEKEKAWMTENKIQSLDCLIDSKPSDLFARDDGLKIGPSEVGCQLGTFNSSGSNIFKGRGNLGFEYFKGSSPADRQSEGLNPIHDWASLQILWVEMERNSWAL